MSVPIRAVTFDHWATLVRDPGGIRTFQIDAWDQVLRDASVAVPRDDLERAIHSVEHELYPTVLARDHGVLELQVGFLFAAQVNRRVGAWMLGTLGVEA